jgi:putative membrane protein
MRWTPSILTTTAALALAVGCENASDRTNTATSNRPAPAPSPAPSRTAPPTTPAPPTATPGSANSARPSGNTDLSGSPGSIIVETDRTFIINAASGGMFEVQSSQAVSQKLTGDAPIQHIALMMIDDHTKANDELRALAQKKGITLPQNLQPRDQAMMDQLKSLSGTDLAQKYRDQQIQAHQDAIAMFEKASTDCKDPEIKAFAQNTLPTLRKHLDHLKEAAEPAGMTGDNDEPTKSPG